MPSWQMVHSQPVGPPPERVIKEWDNKLALAQTMGTELGAQLTEVPEEDQL